MTDRSHTDATIDEQPADRGDELYEVPDGVEPGVTVVEAVADASGKDPISLPPLQQSVDVDAMNELLGTADDSTEIVLSISYADHVVVIDGDGTISVGP